MSLAKKNRNRFDMPKCKSKDCQYRSETMMFMSPYCCEVCEQTNGKHHGPIKRVRKEINGQYVWLDGPVCDAVILVCWFQFANRLK